MTRSLPLLWLERLLLTVGIICLGWYGYATSKAAAFQRDLHTRFEEQLVGAPAPSYELRPALEDRADPTAGEEESVVGLLEVPRLGLSAAVLSGDDESVLAGAAGHLPDTPRPWESGNSAIAAHRDGLFRPLKGIRRGDVIRLRTTRGDLEYRVDELKTVEPTDLSVLAPRRSDSVTLITCYPFNFVGSAPRRFIVHAERIGGHAEATGFNLPSRSLAVVTGYRAVPRQISGTSNEPSRLVSSGRGDLPRVRKRVSRASAGAGRASVRRAEGASSRGDRRERELASRERRPGPAASRNSGSKDEKPAKRRWYHFFRRK